MATFRTQETEEKYKKYREAGNLNSGCKLCEEKSIRDFDFWRLITNNFPYDQIASTNHMLIPKRCVKEQELSDEEKAELVSLKLGYINENYEYILETVEKGKTIPKHMHLHVLVVKE